MRRVAGRAGAGYAPELFDEIAALEDHHFWFRARDRLFLWAVGQYGRNARTMLDVGCGTGHVLAQLRVHLPHLHLVGSELFEEGLHLARRRLANEIDLVRSDARDLPFDQPFDVVGAFDVIEHVVDDARVLDELFRVLRPGGLLLLTVPQHRWLWSGADVRAHHERRYTAASLHPLVRQSGFEIVRSTSFVSLMLPAMVISRLRARPSQDDEQSDLHIAGRLNALAGRVMSWEIAAIRHGVNFAFGGSRLVVARKPAASVRCSLDQ